MAIRRTTKTNRKRIIYQNQAIFSAETGASAPTDINQIHRVQEASHSVEIERVSVNEFGSLSLGQREIIESPTVNLDFSYYVVDGKNEAHTLGLDVMGINTDVEKHAISSIMKGQGEDSRNYYIMITPPDKDASQELDYSEDDYDNMGVIGIGNAYITNYSFNAAIGEIPTANVSAQASNVRFDISGSGFQNPAIDTKDGSLVDQTVQLPKSTTGNLLQYIVRPGDLTLSFDTETLDQGGAVLPGTNSSQSTVAIQSINFELPLSRTPIQEVGSSFPKARQLDFPITATVTVNALLADISSGDLSSLICQDTQKREISVRLGSRCKGFTLMVVSLKNATLDSQSMSSSIGDNKSVDLTFSAQIGGPEDVENGLFFNSEILPVTFSPAQVELFLSVDTYTPLSQVFEIINPTTTTTSGPCEDITGRFTGPDNQTFCFNSHEGSFVNTQFDLADFGEGIDNIVYHSLNDFDFGPSWQYVSTGDREEKAWMTSAGTVNDLVFTGTTGGSETWYLFQDNNYSGSGFYSTYEGDFEGGYHFDNQDNDPICWVLATGVHPNDLFKNYHQTINPTYPSNLSTKKHTPYGMDPFKNPDEFRGTGLTPKYISKSKRVIQGRRYPVGNEDGPLAFEGNLPCLSTLSNELFEPIGGGDDIQLTNICPPTTTTPEPCNEKYAICVSSNVGPFNQTWFTRNEDLVSEIDGYNTNWLPELHVPDNSRNVLYTGNTNDTTWFLFANSAYSGTDIFNPDPFRWVFHSGTSRHKNDHEPVYIAQDVYTNDSGYYCIQQFDLNNKVFEKTGDGSLITITTGQCLNEPPTTTTTLKPPTRPEFACLDADREMNYNFGQYGEDENALYTDSFLGGWGLFNETKEDDQGIFINTMFIFTNTGELAAKVYYTEPLERTFRPYSGLLPYWAWNGIVDSANGIYNQRFQGSLEEKIAAAEETVDYHQEIVFRRSSMETFPIHDAHGCLIPNQTPTVDGQEPNWLNQPDYDDGQYDCLIDKGVAGGKIWYHNNYRWRWYRWPLVKISKCMGKEHGQIISGDDSNTAIIGSITDDSTWPGRDIPTFTLYNGKHPGGECYIGGYYESRHTRFMGAESFFHYEDFETYKTDDYYPTYETGAMFEEEIKYWKEWRAIQQTRGYPGADPNNPDITGLIKLAETNINNYFRGNSSVENVIYGKRDRSFQGWNVLSNDVGIDIEYDKSLVITGRNSIEDAQWIVFGKTKPGDLPDWVTDKEYACTYFHPLGYWGEVVYPEYVQ